MLIIRQYWTQGKLDSEPLQPPSATDTMTGGISSAARTVRNGTGVGGASSPNKYPSPRLPCKRCNHDYNI